MIELPFLTSDIPPIPGVAKADYEDFVVEEIPLYLPSGEGDHVYFTIEKQGLTTHQAIREIARALGVRPRDIGAAGNKDARGRTRQTLSLEHIDPGRVEALSIPRMTVIAVSRHRNKLRTGHLKGNRFTIRVRETDPGRLDDLQTILRVLSARGVPNYFGPQRFGNRGDTWEIGRALLKGDFDAAAAIAAGRPRKEDTGRVLEARTLFDSGRLEEALHAWPSGFGECRSICGGLLRYRGDARRALLGLDKKTLGLYVSAFQSRLFNQIVTARLPEIDRIRLGDVAWKHENGAAFLVEDESLEMPRAERFEISATGPLYGKKMKATSHRVAETEAAVLADAGITADELPQKGPLKCTGGRRPIRFRPEGAEAQSGEDSRGAFFELRFTLPSGCYATAILREILKSDIEA